MESYLNRANAVFCTMLLCVSALAIGNIASSSFLTSPISGSVSVRDVYAFGYNYVLQVSRDFGAELMAVQERPQKDCVRRLIKFLTALRPRTNVSDLLLQGCHSRWKALSVASLSTVMCLARCFPQDLILW